MEEKRKICRQRRRRNYHDLLSSSRLLDGGFAADDSATVARDIDSWFAVKDSPLFDVTSAASGMVVSARFEFELPCSLGAAPASVAGGLIPLALVLTPNVSPSLAVNLLLLLVSASSIALGRL